MTFSLAVLAMKFVMVVKRRRLASVAVVSFLLLTSVDANVAVRAEPAVPDGTAAMLRVRIPFGGRATAVSQTSLTMNFGYHWRLSPGAVRKLEHHFTPALQAGWMLSGRPVFRVGAIDALRVFSDRANAQADDVSGGGNARFLWIGLGVIVVGATVGMIGAAGCFGTLRTRGAGGVIGGGGGTKIPGSTAASGNAADEAVM